MAGGGVGEAALMGAAFGAGRSLLSGNGDPLEGAVQGGILGGAGGALMGGFGGAAGGAESALGAGAGNNLMGYTYDAATGSMLPATATDIMAANAGAAPLAEAMTATGQLAPAYSFDQVNAANAGITTLPGAAANQAVAPQVPNITASLPTGPQSQQRTSPEFLKDPLAWMKESPGKTAAGALGLYGLANASNLTKPNTMTPYQPPTAEQYGLGAKLSPKYRPTIAMQAGGTVEQMSNANSIGQNTGYPQADITKGAYATPWQTPITRNMLEGAADTGVDPISGQMRFAEGGGISGLMNYAKGGMSDLGSYSDGGRMLRGPGDGMSDDIPASISGKQPARLADGEFVVPADVVSHLGNGSTDAGARQLYKMMDKVRTARTGRKSQGKEINPKKYMPA